MTEITVNAISEENVSGRLDIFGWVKTHKRALTIGGIGIISLIGIAIGLKNKDALVELLSSYSKPIEQAVPIEIPSAETAQSIVDVPSTEDCVRLAERYVRMHLRTLHEGQHHSLMKEAEAKALDIDLLPNQTLVDSYSRHDKYVA